MGSWVWLLTRYSTGFQKEGPLQQIISMYLSIHLCYILYLSIHLSYLSIYLSIYVLYLSIYDCGAGSTKFSECQKRTFRSSQHLCNYQSIVCFIPICLAMTEEQDPPSFKNARKKDRERLNELDKDENLEKVNKD